jgi:hypothetical protein
LNEARGQRRFTKAPGGEAKSQKSRSEKGVIKCQIRQMKGEKRSRRRVWGKGETVVRNIEGVSRDRALPTAP